MVDKHSLHKQSTYLVRNIFKVSRETCTFSHQHPSASSQINLDWQRGQIFSPWFGSNKNTTQKAKVTDTSRQFPPKGGFSFLKVISP